MTKVFRRNQRWRTRDGRLAVIDTVRGSNPGHNIYGRVKLDDGTWALTMWTPNGSVYADDSQANWDLITPWPKEPRKPREWTIHTKPQPLVVGPEIADGECVKVREVIE